MMTVVIVVLAGACSSSPQQHKADEVTYNNDASLIENPFAGYGFHHGNEQTLRSEVNTVIEPLK